MMMKRKIKKYMTIWCTYVISLLFLLENHYLLDNSSRFIIQDVPMKISDIYIKENGFLVFFTHWNS